MQKETKLVRDEGVMFQPLVWSFDALLYLKNKTLPSLITGLEYTDISIPRSDRAYI